MAALRLVSSEPIDPPKRPRFKFKEGDAVCLKSGGVVMTVDEPGPVETKCTWLSEVGDNVLSIKFKNSMLHKYVEPKVPTK